MPKRAAAAQPPSLDWPADQVERRPIEALIPYARNAQLHSDAQIDQIAASIEEWGWTIPVLVDEAGGLIAGHGRILAARKLGIGEVPTMVARGWSDEKIRAYRVADNKLAELSLWDGQLLQLELADLRGLMGDSIALTGFSPVELDSLLGPVSNPEAEWRGMPEVDQGDIQSFRSIVVHFNDQASIDEFGERIGQVIPPKQRFIWFPHQERQNLRKLVHVSENQDAA